MDTVIQTKTNILVVDDQIGMLETFTDILEDRDCNVVTADDGFTAIKNCTAAGVGITIYEKYLYIRLGKSIR